MNMMKTSLKAASIALAVGLALGTQLPMGGGFVASVQASNIKVTVNKVPITTLDVSQRTAFLKLQRKKGNLASIALEELIDEALKKAEMRRIGLSIPDKAVNEAFANFASQNKLKPAQLEEILNKSGVTAKHFKEYIRLQMGWGQAVGARFRATGKMTEQEAVRKMLEKGGSKPSATEYMLQQVIFVVPAAKRGQIMGQRKKEATAMRARFNGCESTRQFATGLKDVTVRDLGRFLAPELPPEWADMIKKTQAGGATGIRETEKGVEFIGICRSREVSDDKAAALTLQAEELGGKGGEGLADKYLKELRDKANIVRK
ncbi:MAG: SurA N-terminal domain-containing protein [Rhizobiaceae bacterium]